MSQMNTEVKKIDPITGQVVLGALENVAVEMGHKFARMSYSSIIRESEDFGCALVDISGQQLCESSHSTPLQSGPIPGYVKGIREIMAERKDTFNPGDVIMHNSPYHGASHGPDVGFCIPVFYQDELIGFSVTTAHHLDIGASTPGSCGIVDAVDAYAEGLQFKAIKVYDQGVKNRYVWDILTDNIRAPKLVVGDMEAQIAAARIGAQRYIEIIEKYGLDTVQAASEELMNYSEKMMRDAVKKLPDGEFTAEGFLDGYLDSDDPAKKDLRINVTVKVDGSDLTVDLTGTSPQVTDRPINMPLVGTVDIAIYLTLRSILLDSTVYGNFPQNSGLIRPITIVAPKGTLCNPIFPAPTIARFNSGNIVADTLMKALAQVVPHQVSAGVGNLQVVAFSGKKDENYWVYMDIMEGSYGGRYGKDGMDAVDTLYANTRNNPIEDIESHYPLRVNRYELRDHDSAPGKWRGSNLTINIKPPALVLMETFNMKWGLSVIIVGILSIVTFPWLLITSSAFNTFIAFYSAFLGPLLGILIADYYFVHKQKLNVDALYKNTIKYNWLGLGSLAIGGIIGVFFLSISWMVSMPISAVLYWAGSKYLPNSKAQKVNKEVNVPY